MPSLAHRKLNGPVPKAVVLRVTLSPGHAIWFVGPTRLVSGSTANDATEEVTLPHKLVTTTSYMPVSAVVVNCYGPTGHWPDSVLVYRADGDHALLGTPVQVEADTDVQSLSVERGKLDTGERDICPTASSWAAEELSLPMFEALEDAEIDRIAAACNSAVAA